MLQNRDREVGTSVHGSSRAGGIIAMKKMIALKIKKKIGCCGWRRRGFYYTWGRVSADFHQSASTRRGDTDRRIPLAGSSLVVLTELARILVVFKREDD